MVESKDIHTALDTQKEIFLVGDVSSQDKKGHVILKMKSETEALKLVWDYKRFRGKFSAQFSSIIYHCLLNSTIMLNNLFINTKCHSNQLHAAAAP